MWLIQLGASLFENGGIRWPRPHGGVEGWDKLNPNIFGLFEPQLGQKANKINFGNKNGKNDITHQTSMPMFHPCTLLTVIGSRSIWY